MTITILKEGSVPTETVVTTFTPDEVRSILVEYVAGRQDYDPETKRVVGRCINPVDPTEGGVPGLVVSLVIKDKPEVAQETPQ